MPNSLVIYSIMYIVLCIALGKEWALALQEPRAKSQEPLSFLAVKTCLGLSRDLIIPTVDLQFSSQFPIPKSVHLLAKLQL